jgi:Zn-dependent M28 family amino/carboxypeptidase
MKRAFKKIIFVALIFPAAHVYSQQQDSLTLRRIYDYYLTQSKCYSNLEYLATKIGNRISGSPQAEQAVRWAKKAMYEAGADTVFLQPCLVPHWVRGQKEKCNITLPGTVNTLSLNCLALGSSVGTGSAGLKAKVVEVSSFEELEKLGEKEIKGKVVFYNVFFNQAYVFTGHAYRDVVKYRVSGASMAAKYKAVACIIRSMTSAYDDEPHTGNMRYDTSISKNKIPAIALSYKAADLLHNTLAKNKDLDMYLETNCASLPPVPSFNVVGQINGAEKPGEYILAGGHLDSWDVGQGAHDDGVGIVQSIEILSAFKKSGIKPRHSIRAVAFMNEENGLAGGEAYAKFAVEKKERHIAALETDGGGFTPRGFGIDTTNNLFKRAESWKPLLAPYMVDRISPGGGGSDLKDLEKLGVPCIGFEPDSQRYFDIHHTAADTFDKVNKRELELGAAAIGALLYLIDRNY